MTVAGQIPTKGAPGQKAAVTPKKTAAKTAPKKAAPSKAVAKVDKDKLPTDLTVAKAKALTAKIKKGIGTTWQDLAQAAEGRAWKVLGHKNWQDWLETELGDVPILLMPKEKRKEAVKDLKGKGFSVRAIADITRASKSQVDRDIDEIEGRTTVPNGTVKDDGNVIDIPPGDISEEPDEEPDEDGAPVTQITRDDRPQDTTNIGRKPTVVNVVSVARTLSKDLDNVRIRLESLVARDDYADNKVDVQGTLETAVGDFIDTLAEDFDDILRERAASLFQTEPEPV